MVAPIFASLLSVAALLGKANGHPPAPPGSSIKETVGTWEYRGCYIDFGPRILNFRFDVPEGNTAERCTALCASHGYGLAGLEYGSECWCDNYNIYGTLPVVADGQCNFACPGDDTEWCGAGNRMVLYENTAATPPSPSSCIDWRIWTTFQNARMYAIPKSGSGSAEALYSIPSRDWVQLGGGSQVNYRLMTTCPAGCTWTDSFNIGILDNRLTSYEAKGVGVAVGGGQSFERYHPAVSNGHPGYCGKPSPLSPHGGFIGFPLLSVNGDTDSWALCPNNTASGRPDVVYSPVSGHPHYDQAQCTDVYIEIRPYIINWSNYGPQP
ncbi:hypothetical protein CC1G_08561 [Coprinopsis cinerea okayama7|uniref:WSC domain-containing protein n=1 Tax=Coprinopsis cinerea (strain Okayama-7 / 130 / ATCC MYA-4618 / FGSC 9003) TaxID=240176 RepID=A8NCR8_COPC7|nr:hypothetical protein CC1G_08561 [Coprinopsis cinerea okayama7\|eukprot:XP_001832611.1 hypothetical protein CC1G_08561 [Coprinopsis cinerea okayama7\